MRKAEKTQLMGELALKVYELEDGPKHMRAKVEIDPFYNPNQQQRVVGGKATGSGEDTQAAQKRTQAVDSGPRMWIYYLLLHVFDILLIFQNFEKVKKKKIDNILVISYVNLTATDIHRIAVN